MTEFSVFDYLYCDAGNYKAWGGLLLKGNASAAEAEALQACLNGGEFFIAEQVGVPALYEELWHYSDVPTEDDHVWHTFHALRPATPDESTGCLGVRLLNSSPDSRRCEVGMNDCPRIGMPR